VKRLLDKLTGHLFVALATMLGAAAAWAEEAAYPLPPQVQWQDAAGATYSAIGSLPVAEITQAKLDACLKASGNHKFCRCLSAKLPVGLTFDGYIQSVTKSRQQLGYDGFSDNEKRMIDMAFAIRNQCVAGSSEMLVLADEQPRPATSAPAPAASAHRVEAAESTASATATPPARPASNRSYLVQVASFRHPEDAQEMKSRLATHGMHAYTESVDLPQRGRWHRVYLGPYARRDRAEQVKSELQAQLRLSAWVKRGQP